MNGIIHDSFFLFNPHLHAKTLSSFVPISRVADLFRYSLFKTKGSTLKYASVALDQERTLSSFIVSKFEYAQCIGGRPVKLKTISRGLCSFRFL